MTVNQESPDLSRVRSLMAEGKGDRLIGSTLGVSRHQARELIKQVQLENARGEATVVDVAPVPQTPEEFAAAIGAAWRSSVRGIIDAGRLLIMARESLDHGEFGPMIESQLPFGVRTAEMLMRIARHPGISNPKFVSYLPPSWGSLHELTPLEPEEFERAIEAGLIHPGMTRADVERIRNPEPMPPHSSAPDGEAPSVGLVGPPPSSNSDPDARLRAADGPAGEAQAPAALAAVFLAAWQSDVPPRTISSAQTESEVMGDRSGTAADDAAADAPNNAPPRQDHGDSGGAEAPNPAWNASRVEPGDSLDFFPTGPWITRTLFERVFKRLRIGTIENVWEPACGEGHMAEVMREYIPNVYATDIHDYGHGDATCDFLGDWVPAFREDPDWIITNPPYNGRTLEFVLRALNIAQSGVAIFTATQWIAEGVDRYQRLYRERPPTLIAFFSERAPLHKGRWEPQGRTQTAYCWVVWIKDRTPLPPFWIPPGCRESLSKPDDAERFTAHPVKRKEHLRQEQATQAAPRIAAPVDMPDILPELDRRTRRETLTRSDDESQET